MRNDPSQMLQEWRRQDTRHLLDTLVDAPFHIQANLCIHQTLEMYGGLY